MSWTGTFDNSCYRCDDAKECSHRHNTIMDGGFAKPGCCKTANNYY